MFNLRNFIERFCSYKFYSYGFRIYSNNSSLNAKREHVRTRWCAEHLLFYKDEIKDLCDVNLNIVEIHAMPNFSYIMGSKIKIFDPINKKNSNFPNLRRV